MRASDIALFEKHGIDMNNPPWVEAYFVSFASPGRILKKKGIFSTDGESVILIGFDGSISDVLRERDDYPFDGHAYAETFNAARLAAIGHATKVIRQASALLTAAYEAKVVEC